MEADLLFYRQGEENGEWSNFADYPVYYRRKVFRDSESGFQFDKFLGTDPEHAEKIRQSKTPKEAAALGRDRTHVLRPDWDKPVSFELPEQLARIWQEIVGEPMLNKDWSMLQVVRCKIRQHPELRARLLDTGNRRLVEHTVNDRYWADGGDGSGKNMLGKILMVIRAEERLKDAAKALRRSRKTR